MTLRGAHNVVGHPELEEPDAWKFAKALAAEALPPQVVLLLVIGSAAQTRFSAQLEHCLRYNDSHPSGTMSGTRRAPATARGVREGIPLLYLM